MSPSSREREYARRRYEKYQAKQAQRLAEARRARRRATLAGAAALVVAAGAGIFFVLHGTTSSDSATGAPSPSAAVSASADPSNPCPVPAVKPGPVQSFPAAPDPKLAEGRSWKLTITTTCGVIEATIDGAKAPRAVANAIFLSGKKFWDGSPCHRMTVEGLKMLQCGDPTGSGRGGPGYGFGPVENAPADGIYKRGVLAMARTPDAAKGQGSQFFLVFGDSPLEGGYTVFGTVTKGLDILDKIAAGGVGAPDATGTTAPRRAISIVGTSVTSG